MLLKSSLVLTLSFLACGEDEPIDDSGDGCETATWNLDADGDGFGGTATLEACEAPAGYVDNSDDCDDLDASAFPGGSEVCDGVDNDCDGSVDNEASDALSLFTDADGDGFGDAATSACELSDGLSEIDGDCDDGNSAVFPGAEEVCDGADNDCDGVIDGASVPTDFATIQEAVDAAEDEGLVCVDAGTYNEYVTISNKTVRLEGAGSGSTVLDMNGSSYSAVTLENARGAQVVGMTLTNSSAGNGGAIYATVSEDVLFQDLEITGNHCTYSCSGTAVYLWLTDAELVDVDVVDNSIELTSSYYSWAYGFVRFEASDVSWVGGSVSDNSTVAGSSTSWSSNVYSYAYSGLYVYNTDFYAQDLEIHDNLADATAVGSSYAQAYAYGPFYAGNSDLVLDNLSIEGNTNVASGTNDGTGYGYGYGYGAFTFGSVNVDWIGGSIRDNRTEGYGSTYGGSYLSSTGSAGLDLADLSIHDNVSEGTSGNGSSCYGMQVSSSWLDWTRVDIRGNEVNCDHDVYGMIYTNSTDADFTNLILAGNSVQGTNYGTALLSNWYGTQTLTNSLIHDNEMAADYAYGGVFFVGYGNSNGSFELVNTAVTDNTLSVTTTNSSYLGASVASSLWGAEFIASYSDFHGNSSIADDFIDYYDGTWTPVGSDGNIDEDPGYASTSGSPSAWDLSLSSGSALIDAGDPAIEDSDGSVSDIGAYGGPESF